MRYTYTLKMQNAERTYSGVQELVSFVNEQAGCDILTTHMVYNLFSRPHKANKRVFSSIKIEREACR